jgi:Ca2+-binding RTX toxin-like protein
LGDGQDTVTDYSGTDQVVFGAGINAQDIKLVSDYANDYSLIVKVGTGGDQVRLKNFFYYSGNNYKIETLKFADGSSISLGGGVTLAGTNPGGEILAGTDYNDILTGNDGPDNISSGYGDDIISGGKGNDSIDGSYGNDTYLFNLGDGQDTVTDYAGTDQIVFRAGINAQDILMEASGSNLVIKFAGLSDQVTINNFFSSSGYKIENLKFADGSIFNIMQGLTVTGGSGNDNIIGSPFTDTLNGGNGNDYIYGSDGDDNITGGEGNDALKGGNGDDKYYFSSGYGNDIITEQG